MTTRPNGDSTPWPTSADPIDGDVRRRIVLVASDDPLIAPRIVNLLEANGFAISVAPDASKAWSSAAQEKPILAIVDILIPGGDTRDSASLTLGLLEQGVPVLLLCSISSVPVDPRLEVLPRTFEDHSLLPVVNRLLTLITE